MAEFEAARMASGYTNGVILGAPLRPANIALQDLAVTLEEGIALLELKASDVDLLITHSPAGDEHRSAHHCQAFRELRRWTSRKAVPFGYFSCIAVPWYIHVPFLFSLRRRGSLHMVNGFRCRRAVRTFLNAFDPSVWPFLHCPRYYLQFLTSGKASMLSCYESIGLKAHSDGYASFTNDCEGLYLFDELAYAPFAAIETAMDVPAGRSVFEQRSFFDRAATKLRTRLPAWLREKK
jgi:hypothetical protein